MQSTKLAKLLLKKAEQDQYVMNRLLDDTSAPDEVIGFHAQDRQWAKRCVERIAEWASSVVEGNKG